MTIDATDFLMGGGIPSATKYMREPGSSVALAITVPPKVSQQTDIDSKEPKFFKGTNDPMMQLVVTGSTDQRDPERDDDDGSRSIYVKGKQMTAAVRDAVKAVKAKGLEVGGVLTLIWVSGGPRYLGDQNWAKENPKVWAAQYQPASVNATGAFLNGGQPAKPNAPAGQSANPPQWAQPAPAAAPAQQAPAAPAGIDPAIWAQMGPDQQAKVLAAIG